MSLFTLLITAGIGMLLGVSLAGPPGPVTAIMVQRSLISVAKGFAVAMGAMSADFILMLVILSIGAAADITRFDNFIFLVGAAFFVYLAYSIARSQDPENPGRIRNSGYLTGLTIGLINPMQIGWWLTAGLSVLQKFGIVALIFLFVGIVIYTVFLAFVVHLASVNYAREVELGVKIFSVVSLAAFGGFFFLSAVSGFTGIALL